MTQASFTTISDIEILMLAMPIHTLMRAFIYEATRAFTNHKYINTDKDFESEMKKSSRQGTRFMFLLIVVIESGMKYGLLMAYIQETFTTTEKLLPLT